MNYKDEHFQLNQTYEVLSIFNRVINLRLEDRVYAIFHEQIDKAPYSLILESSLFDQCQSRSVVNQPLYVGNVACEVFNCVLSPCLPQKVDLSLLEKMMNTFQRSDSVFEREFQKKRKEKQLMNLIGLGLGLTPSGDDYIVGIMAGYYSEHNDTPQFFDKIIKKAETATHFISYNYLRNASQRLFKQEIIDVVSDLNNQAKLEKLLSFGSSSGQDVLYGIYDYFSGLYDDEMNQ